MEFAPIEGRAIMAAYFGIRFITACHLLRFRTSARGASQTYRYNINIKAQPLFHRRSLYFLARPLSINLDQSINFVFWNFRFHLNLKLVSFAFV